MNCDPSNLHLTSSWDYRHEPLCPAGLPIFSLNSCVVMEPSQYLSPPPHSRSPAPPQVLQSSWGCGLGQCSQPAFQSCPVLLLSQLMCCPAGLERGPRTRGVLACCRCLCFQKPSPEETWPKPGAQTAWGNQAAQDPMLAVWHWLVPTLSILSDLTGSSGLGGVGWTLWTCVTTTRGA
jgi:hypothetical protein